ncbi:cytochrome P450 4c21-like [Brevipalpus obovatus]|uniref:cytochrome P450 4c21-like n=1 Tax=Brevipalpus obovatus TaxID=246614 RepID=UPI003D9E7135
MEKILGNKKFLDRGWPSRALADGRKNLISLADSDWYERRNIVSPSYSLSVLQGFIPTIVEQSLELVESLVKTNGKLVPIEPILQRHVLLMSLETSMGLKDRIDDRDRRIINEALERFFRSQYDRTAKVHRWNGFMNRMFDLITGNDNGSSSLQKCGLEIVSRRIQDFGLNCDGNEKIFTDFKNKRQQAFMDHMITMLIESKNSKYKLTMEDVLDELIAIMASSYESIVTASQWALHCLASYPEIQEKLFESLANFDENDLNITIPFVNQFTYLDQCIKEALRLRSPLFAMFRQVNENTQIDAEYTIPEGTLALVFLYFVHRDPKVYPCPELYDPDRFSPKNVQKIPPEAYVPFGDGSRRCIGEKLAYLELKLILASIVKKFRVITNDQDVRVKMGLASHPVRPIMLQFIDRCQTD